MFRFTRIVLPLLALALFASCQKDVMSSHKLSVKEAWALEVPETQSMSAAFLKIANKGDSDDTLLSAESDIAENVELHEMVLEDEKMKMRMIESIPVPAGETVELKRGGLHIMLIGLKKPMKEGESVHLVLNFKTAGKIEIDAPVKKQDMNGEMSH